MPQLATELQEEYFQRFVSGQLRIVSDLSPTRCGEVTAITNKGNIVYVCLGWFATKHGRVWFKSQSVSYVFDLSRCKVVQSYGNDVGALLIDCPHSRTAITFYPKGHKEIVPPEKLTARPHLQLV